MRTRSGKVLAATPRPLQAQGTLTEITASQTGQGTHTRWIRPKEPQAQAQPPATRAVTSPPVSTAGPSTTALLLPSLSTPGPNDFGGKDFDLSAYITPEPWKPTSPPRPSPLERTKRVSNPESLFALLGTNHRPGSKAHERLQESLKTGAKADKPRGRPLVGPTGSFIHKTASPLDINASPKAVRFTDAAGGTVHPSLPPLALGPALGSPWCSQEENVLPPLRQSNHSPSPTRRNFK